MLSGSLDLVQIKFLVPDNKCSDMAPEIPREDGRIEVKLVLQRLICDSVKLKHQGMICPILYIVNDDNISNLHCRTCNCLMR